MRKVRIPIIIAAALLNFVWRVEAASISGKVTDQKNGQPIGSAKITALTTASGSADSLVYQAFSDSSGRYALTGLVNGAYALWCEHENYATAFRRITVTNDSNLVGIDFQLTPRIVPIENRVSGLVFNSVTNTPIANAIVYLWTKTGADGLTEAIFGTTSDANGRYEFRAFYPTGKYVLLAVASGYQPFQSDTLLVADTTVINLDVSLVPVGNAGPATLTGHVWEARPDSTNSTPIAGAEIRLIGFGANGDSLEYRATTGADGEYTITNIPPGIGAVYVTAIGYLQQSVNLLALPSGVTTLDFYLVKKSNIPNGFITGKVFFESTGIPILGAIINVRSVQGVHHATAITDAMGEYSAQIPEGNYVVNCRVEADSLVSYEEFYDNVLSFAEATMVTVRASETTGNINFGIPELNTFPKNVAIRGKVLSEDGAPLENATVIVRSTRAPDSLEIAAQTNIRGEYSITTPQVRNAVLVFFVQAGKAGYATEYYNNRSAPFLADPIYVFSDTTIDNIDFSLAPLASNLSILGSVTNEAGAPLRSAFVVTSNLATGEIAFTFTDGQGNYALGNLKPFNHIILFAADGHVPEFYDDASLWEQARPVFPANPLSGINAILTPIVPDSGSGALTGVVRAPNASPLSGVLIIARNASGNAVGFDLTDGQGMYQIAGFTGGRYTIQATKVRFRSQVGEVLYSPNATGTQLANFTLEHATTSAETSEEQKALPVKFELSANYPNPFNPATTIHFGLPKAQEVRLAVYNVLGREVKELLNSYVEAGRHNLEWNGTDSAGKPVASGIYFYSLQTGQTRLVRKMVLSK
ncbi:carboxypeptidase regulatory-like domain-containing protein [candidate division KSB1 bacterium]|nr:carboxypeptidase regulatory-like domain-containing protein [candidate division KSB1 bacterium]